MSGQSATVRLLNTPYLLWSLLALPGLYWLYAYSQETLFYGEVIHRTGALAVQLMILALAVTPLRLLFPWAAWVRWLMARRRYLGVAAFGYAFIHAVIYIERRPELAYLLEDAGEIGMWTGWLGLFLMLALAITSNDASVRLLGTNWRRLHRAVHAAAVLSIAHWILTAFNPNTGYIYLGILVLLELVRIWKAHSARTV